MTLSTSAPPAYINPKLAISPLVFDYGENTLKTHFLLPKKISYIPKVAGKTDLTKYRA
jgi:hypothetical protein